MKGVVAITIARPLAAMMAKVPCCAAVVMRSKMYLRPMEACSVLAPAPAARRLTRPRN